MLPDAAWAQVRPDAGRIERDFERDRVPLCAARPSPPYRYSTKGSDRPWLLPTT
jgi:hypothetical protein